MRVAPRYLAVARAAAPAVVTRALLGGPLPAGPVLVKQDPLEAKSNVTKRLEYIKGERRAPRRERTTDRRVSDATRSPRPSRAATASRRS